MVVRALRESDHKVTMLTGMYACVCMYVCVCVFMYACMYVCMHVCMYVWICMYVCMYVWICMYVCVYVCMYVSNLIAIVIIIIIIIVTYPGDALLTSLHVAKQVGICDTDKRTLTLIGKNDDDVTTIGTLKGFETNGDKKG